MKNTAKIQSNELFNANASIYEVWHNHFRAYFPQTSALLSDYNRGVKRAKLTVIPHDYYYTNGTKAKDWNNGDIFKVNEIIRVLNKEGTGYLKDSQNRDVLFRIVGRKVRYDGQVLIDLELQEIIR